MIPVTFTENVQLPLAAIVAPARLTEADPAVAVIVPPPQVPVRPLGVATSNPAGSVSVKLTPVRLAAVLGFVTVNDRLVLDPNRIDAAPKAFVIEGGAITVRNTVLVLPVPALAEFTVTELGCMPAVIPVTLTENVQFALPASVAPDRITEFDPAIAVIVPPPQEPDRPFGVETTRPLGTASVKEMPVTATVALGFMTVKLRVVEPPRGMVAEPKSLPIEGGSITVKLVIKVLLVPAMAALTCTELFFTPSAVPVTLTENVQLPPPAMSAPERLTEEDPAVAVMVPAPQVPDNPFGVDTTSPAVSVSVKATPVNAAAAFGFVMVKLRLVVPFIGILVAPNPFVIDGGASTVTVAVLEVEPVPPSRELTVPVVLFFAPTVVPVTFKKNAQLIPAAIVPPERLIVLDPANALMVPAPQVPVTPLGVPTTNPAGSVSVNETPVNATAALEFDTVKFKEVVPFRAMEENPKLFWMVGGATTAKAAVA
jgi:hypothetical protein